MREKELRLALICYGGISLAVYMHGITKEVWRLARASRDFHAGEQAGDGSQAVYRRLLETIADEAGIELRVLVDILTGASAGGINAIFLAQAIRTGQSLEPLTDLWLDSADVFTDFTGLTWRPLRIILNAGNHVCVPIHNPRSSIPNRLDNRKSPISNHK